MTKIENEVMTQPFRGLASPEDLMAAAQAAAGRGVPLTRILHAEYGIPHETLLTALRDYYHCASIEYDERLPIPPQLLKNLPPSSVLAQHGWFPVIKDTDGTTVIAAADPADAAMRAEVESVFGFGPY